MKRVTSSSITAILAFAVFAVMACQNQISQQSAIPTITATLTETPAPSATSSPTIIPTATTVLSPPEEVSVPEITLDNLAKLSMVRSIEIPSIFGYKPFTAFRFLESVDGNRIVMLYSYSYMRSSVQINLGSEEVSEQVVDGGDVTIVISPDGNFSAIEQEQSLEPKILLRNLSTNTEQYLGNRCNQPANFPGCILEPEAFTSDGRLLITSLGLSGSWRGGPVLPISLWDTSTGKMISQYRGPGGQAYVFVAFTPDEGYFLVRSVKIPFGNSRWELFSMAPFARKWVFDTKQSLGQASYFAAFSPDQKNIAVSFGRGIWLLNFNDGKLVNKIEFTGVASGLTYSADSSLLFATLGSSNKGSKIQVFSSSDGEPVANFYTEFPVNNLSMSPDGKYLLMTRASIDLEIPNQLDIYAVQP